MARTNPRVRSSVIGAIAALALLISGCAGGGTPPGSNPSEKEFPSEMTTVTVAMQTPSSLGFLHLGDEQGFFKDRNLQLMFIDVATIDVGITSLLSNTVQFATVNPGVMAVAANKKLPVGWAAVALTGPEKAVDDNVGLYVTANSGIKSYRDLEGKRVQVSCINCISDLWVRAAVQKDGGDPDAVQFVVMPTADALPALQRGNIDSMLAVSQFLPAANAAGHRKLGDPMLDLALGQPVLAFAAAEAWAKQNPEVVRAFAAAASESAEYTDAHKDEWRAILPKYYPQQVPNAEAAAKVDAHWSGCFHKDAIQTILDRMNDYGWIDDLAVDGMFLESIEPNFC
jgi:NitT/TauT family transport system substrate-binding protein